MSGLEFILPIVSLGATAIGTIGAMGQARYQAGVAEEEAKLATFMHQQQALDAKAEGAQKRAETSINAARAAQEAELRQKDFIARVEGKGGQVPVSILGLMRKQAEDERMNYAAAGQNAMNFARRKAAAARTQAQAAKYSGQVARDSASSSMFGTLLQGVGTGARQAYDMKLFG